MANRSQFRRCGKQSSGRTVAPPLGKPAGPATRPGMSVDAGPATSSKSFGLEVAKPAPKAWAWPANMAFRERAGRAEQQTPPRAWDNRRPWPPHRS